MLNFKINLMYQNLYNGYGIKYLNYNNYFKDNKNKLNIVVAVKIQPIKNIINFNIYPYHVIKILRINCTINMI